MEQGKECGNCKLFNIIKTIHTKESTKEGWRGCSAITENPVPANVPCESEKEFVAKP